MIKLIYGAKGSGKTKRIIEQVNEAALTAKGDVVYVTDNAKHSIEIKHTVRFVDSAEYGIKDERSALGFIKGILSLNNDIVQIYIDGLARMANMDISGMEDFYKELEKLCLSDKVDFIVTVSAEIGALPGFLKRYI